MLITLKNDIEKNEIIEAVRMLKQLGFETYQLGIHNILKVSQQIGPADVSIIKSLDFVADISYFEGDFILGSRKFNPVDTIVNVDNHKIGNGYPSIIAGPCSVESFDQLDIIASELAEMEVPFFRAGAYKPRTSPYCFQGLKSKGLEYLNEIKNRYGLKIVTEVISTDKIDEVSDVADILQVGTRNMYNYPLLEELGKQSKPVLLKRGMSAPVNEFLLASEYLTKNGNQNVILCERGIKTFETATRNTFDLNAVPLIKQKSHLPIIADPSHATGIRSLVKPMALAAVACGADGLMLEVHNNPDEALTDGAQSITPSALKDIIENIKMMKAGFELQKI